MSVIGKGAKKSYIESYQQENSFFGVPCFFSVIDDVLTRGKDVQNLGNVTVSFILALVAKYKVVIAGDSSYIEASIL